MAREDVIIRKPDRRVFLSDEMERNFNKDGFITMDLLDESSFSKLMGLLDKLKKSADQGNVSKKSEYELSFFNRDAEYRKRVVQEVYGFFKPYIDSILDDYEPLIVNLFNKKPGSGEIPVHQNWSFVDEMKFTTVSVWIPLCNVSRKNGTLEVVPGTHNTLTNYRSPTIPWVFEGLQNVLKKKYMKPLELTKGQIGILDDAILHWSSENNSHEDRATIQLIMKPRESTAVHYYCEDLKRGELSVYEVDSDFFTFFEMNERPKGVNIIATDHFRYHKLNEKELKARIN
ncbi:MAG: phytanoyl-CoA dioxygenase family protein [Bacteroidetes bacterium]|nr:phytanoyl-CoA dioxygenase family protein [Bacteroidota bacterium]